MSALIYHITSRAAWQAALADGQYTADSLATQGFIHCSTAGQVTRVANAIFSGQRGLALLRIEPGKLAAEIRWENTEGGEELFPHVYGPLNLEAVSAVATFEPGPEGNFTLPDFD